MKFTAFILLAFCLQVSATTLAQNVTLSEHKAPLEKVINEIKRQTGFSFFYNQDWLQQSQPVDIQVKNAPLELVLKTCFVNQPFDYAIVSKTIVLKLKEKPKVEKPEVAIPVTISGRVTDSLGTPLIGATIKINNGKNYLTNEKGEFSLDANSGDELTISYIGYRPFNTKIVPNMPYLTITLHASTSKLTEVVVSTGYQTLPKERATGSFDLIDNKLYNREVSTDVLSRLNGIANSLYFNNTGENQSAGNIFIRGLSTIDGGTTPLIVVDNFPYAGDINNINPNDVENITVLKDAAAASIWGAKAGNGVIVITTKKGKYNQPFQATLTTNLTIQDKPNLFYDRNFLNSNDFINVEQFLYSKGFYSSDLSSSDHRVISPVVRLLADQDAGLITPGLAKSKIDSMRTLDNRAQQEEYFYRKAVTQQYNLALTGGTQTVNYYLSAGYDRHLSPTIGNDYNKQTIHSYTNLKPLKNLDVQVGMDYTHLSNNPDAYNLANFYSGGGKGGYYPYAMLADARGNHLALPKGLDKAFTDTAGAGKLLNWTYRPLDENAHTQANSQTNDISMNIKLQYAINKVLSLGIAYQFEKNNVQFKQIHDAQSYYARDLINRYTQRGSGSNFIYPIPLGGILDQTNSNTTANNVRPVLNFNKNWNGIHELTAIAGMEVNETHAISNSTPTVYGYNDDLLTFTNVNYNPNSYPFFDGIGGASNIPTNVGYSDILNRFVSYYANAAYTYKNRYIVSGSIKKDESNLFGANTNRRGVPLWSSGLKWKLSDEPFYKFTWLPDLALRASYGFQGNVVNSLPALSVIGYSTNAGATNLNFAGVRYPSNPDLRWEKVGQLNVGLDFGFKNNIVSGSVEYFHKNAVDLIASAPVDYITGFTQLTQNVANLSSKGIDIQLNAKWLDHQFRWLTQINANYVTSNITKYLLKSTTAGATTGGGINPLEGHDPYAIFSYKFAGLDPATGDPQGYVNGQLSKDYSKLANPTSINDLVEQGTNRPPYFGNIMNTFFWKGFTLSANVLYRFGFNFRKPTIEYNALFNSWVGNSDYLQRWQKPGDELKTTIPSMTYPANSNRDQFYSYSTATVLKGDFIRLQDINFGYDINSIRLGNYMLKKLTVYIYANNLGIIWKANKEGIDPEAVNGYPVPRTISFGLRTTF